MLRDGRMAALVKLHRGSGGLTNGSFGPLAHIKLTTSDGRSIAFSGHREAVLRMAALDCFIGPNPSFWLLKTDLMASLASGRESIGGEEGQD
jgi:hypothetical protein